MIELRYKIEDKDNLTEKELEELAKVINFMDENDIDYDLNPPVNYPEEKEKPYAGALK